MIPLHPWLFLALVLLAAGLAAAFDLTFPAACTLGENCQIQNLFDPDPQARDAQCGPLTYDGHDGIDVALSTLADKARDVAVLAAVEAVRDRMRDVLQGQPGSPDVTRVECGNGVLVSHGDGWEARYCHMAQGGITMQEGERVSAGRYEVTAVLLREGEEINRLSTIVERPSNSGRHQEPPGVLDLHVVALTTLLHVGSPR